MHTYNLPKKYLSYSALDLWLKSPKQFRKRYYEDSPGYASPEMNFGKHIATMLEDNHESVSHIRRYAKSEQAINTVIEGIPIFGFLDSFDPETQKILEYKTGKHPWTQERVQEHKQLDIYSLAVQTIYGSVNDTCHLIWMETEVCEPRRSGLITHEDSHKIRLTGRVEEFERVIPQTERDQMRDLLVQVAQEISDDFTYYEYITQ